MSATKSAVEADLVRATSEQHSMRGYVLHEKGPTPLVTHTLHGWDRHDDALELMRSRDSDVIKLVVVEERDRRQSPSRSGAGGRDGALER